MINLHYPYNKGDWSKWPILFFLFEPTTYQRNSVELPFNWIGFGYE